MRPSPVNALTARWAGACADESFVLSGAGVWPLLALLASAADGPAREELGAAIGIDPGQAAAKAGAVLESLSGPSVRSALGLWFARSLPLRPAWVASLPEGLCGPLDGDPAVDQPRLDAWAAERTGGLVPAMPIAVSADTRLVLAGALTVRTRWLRPFVDGYRTFDSGPWAGRDLAVLHRSTEVLDRLRVVTTPSGPLTTLRVMGTGGIDVHLALGAPRSSPGEVLAGAITGGGPAPLEEGPGVSIVQVQAPEPGDRLEATVPRFTVTATHDLTRLPEVFGLSSATDTGRGHFPGISTEPLALSQAGQNAVAVFSATGFEAAAVTAFGAVAGAALPSRSYRVKRVYVEFGRPFGFLAVERRSGLILAAGWVAEPETADAVAG